MSTKSTENDSFCKLLSSYKKEFEKKTKSYRTPHKFTRRLAVWSLLLWVPSLLFAVMLRIPELTLPQGVACIEALYPFVFVVFFSIWSCAYFSNRLRGFTRGWSRNRTMVKLLDNMQKQYEMAIQNMDDIKDDELIVKVQRETAKNLFALLDANYKQEHHDIVGDYLASHVEAAKAVQGAKK